MISEIKIPFNKNLFLKDDQIASDDNTIESEGEVDTDSNGNEENEETIAIFSRKKQVTHLTSKDSEVAKLGMARGRRSCIICEKPSCLAIRASEGHRTGSREF